jgi:hypothetical protein
MVLLVFTPATQGVVIAISSPDPREFVLTHCPKCISYPLHIAIPTPTKFPVRISTQKPMTRSIYKDSSAYNDIRSSIEKYAHEYSVDVDVLEQISRCESGFNPNATNGPYGGLFQFHPGTWVSTRRRMGLDENTDLRFHAEESIKTAAYKISRDGTSAWAQCSHAILSP